MAKRTKKLTSQVDENDEIRINKFLSESGVCSRREADRYITEGKVKIDGIIAEMGSKVTKDSVVTFLDKPIKREEKLVLIAFNKPEGIVCTTDQKEPDNIIDFIKYGMRIYPIGRLDKDSEGLILLTNDGNIVNKILRAEHQHEKEYVVRVNKEITAEFIQGMSTGVPILDTVTNPCKVTQIDKYTFNIVLTQGLNRQIRRMCEYFEYRVVRLTRIRIMNIQLGRLKTGDYRNVTEKEIEELSLAFEQQKEQKIEKIKLGTIDQKKTKHDKLKFDKVKYDKNKFDKSKYDKTKHEKTDQDKTKHEINKNEKIDYEKSKHEMIKHEKPDHEKSKYVKVEHGQSKYEKNKQGKSIEKREESKGGRSKQESEKGRGISSDKNVRASQPKKFNSNQPKEQNDSRKVDLRGKKSESAPLSKDDKRRSPNGYSDKGKRASSSKRSKFR